LGAEGLTPEAWGGKLVGLSPGPLLRVYDRFFDWDFGFLVLAGDRLSYLGERTRFALTREQIKEVSLGPGPPGGRRRLYVVWRDEARGAGGTFQLSSGELRWVWWPARGGSDLAARLRQWQGQQAGPGDVPGPLRQPTSPDLP